MSTRAGYAGALRGPALPGNAQPRRLDSPETSGPRPGRIPPPPPRRATARPTRSSHRAHEQAAPPGRAAPPAASAGAPRRAGAQAPPQPRHPGDRDRRRRGGRVPRCCSPACSTGTTTRAPPPTTPARPPRPVAAATTNADGTISCTYAPDESGNPNLTDVGTPAGPRGHPDPGHRQPADEHRPGRPHADPGPDAGPVRRGQLRLPGRAGLLRRHPLPPRWSTSRASASCSAATRPAPGSGGPTYKYAEEVTPETTYPRGTIAMANTSAPGTTGSQFFLCFVDTELPPGLHRRRHDRRGRPAGARDRRRRRHRGRRPEPATAPRSIPVTIESMTVVA